MADLNAVDMSRWGGELTPAEAACMKAAGIDTVIVATGPGGYGLLALQQAETASAAGIKVEAYCFLEFEDNPVLWVRAAVARLEGFAVARWWLDIEDATNGRNWTAAQRIDYSAQALAEFDRLTGTLVDIYSGGWFWVPYMANTDRFAREGRKLWNSYYDGQADIDGLPYGGWTEVDVAIEQYEGTSDVCGQSVDKNHVYIEAGEVAGMSPEEHENLLLAVFAGGEERDEAGALKPREERLRLARYRRDAAANGVDTEGRIVQSVREEALSDDVIGAPAVDYERLAGAVELAGKAAATSIRNMGKV